MRWTPMEPAGAVMNRVRRGRSSDSEARMAGVYAPLDPNCAEHHAGPREMPAGHGWNRLRAEAHGGPGRAGQRSKMYRWRLVTQLCQQPTETVFFRSRLRPFIGQSAIVIETRFHAIDSTISYDTISWARDRACASPHIRYVSIGQPSARMRPG